MVRIAVAGAGYWGPNLIRNVYQLPESDLSTICDTDTERLEAIGRQYPAVPRTTDYQQILENQAIDAVVLATPAATHFEMTRQALKAGKHVLVEKPLALSSQDARELVQLADGQDLILMVGHTFLYNTAVHMMKRLIDNGDIGSLYYIYSNRVNLGRVRQDINALWNIAPHDVSILLYLIGHMPVQVTAQGATFLQEGIEDVVFTTMLFDNNVVGHVQASWLDPSKIRQMTVVGSQKMVVYDDVASEGKIKIYDKGALKVGNGRIYGEYQIRLHSGDIHIPKVEMTEPLRNELMHFVECVQSGQRPLSDGRNGWEVVRILEAAQHSLRNGNIPVRIEDEKL